MLNHVEEENILYIVFYNLTKHVVLKQLVTSVVKITIPADLGKNGIQTLA